MLSLRFKHVLPCNVRMLTVLIDYCFKLLFPCWYRLDIKELQVQLTYRVSPEHELSYARRNFWLVGLIQHEKP
jgi:hypothetical protein